MSSRYNNRAGRPLVKAVCKYPLWTIVDGDVGIDMAVNRIPVLGIDKPKALKIHTHPRKIFDAREGRLIIKAAAKEGETGPG
jgi:hypothetical protein